ncbi:MAG: hypothetical protein HZB64_09355 [Rhodocyclales bacterium]|nr:hypothetical protein [Rhodocyclales bacterium]
MKNRYRKLATLLLVCGAFGLFAGQADAHGGLSVEKDQCKLTIGKYLMHFTGYQPEATGSKEFCEDIPEVGHTIVVLDAIDQELREIPIEIRVVRDTGDMSNLDAITVFHLPSTIYSSGSVSFEYRFDAPGKFVGLVTAGSGKDAVESRFPFSVASGRAKFASYYPFVGIVLLGAALYWFSSVRRKKKLHSEKSGMDA